MSVTIAQAQNRSDFSANCFRCAMTVTVPAGSTYVTGGFGPVGAISAYNLGVDLTTPIASCLASEANPPSGYFWVYNYVTDKVQCYVASNVASGSPAEEPGPLVELANGAYFNVKDVVSVLLTYSREQ